MKLALIIAVAMAFACFTNAVQLFSVPDYSQKDPRWGSTTLGFGSYNIAKKGCFLTCHTAMIASQGIKVNGQTPDPANMNTWFKANKQFDSGMLFYKAPEKFGFKYEGKVSSKSTAIDAMNKGKFVLLHVENDSHWVVALGYDSNGYSIMDPAKVRTSYKYSEVPEVAIYAPPNNPNPALIGSSAPTPTPTPAEPTPEPTPAEPTPAEPTPAEPTPEQTPSPSDDSDDNMMIESLSAHNEWRSDVGVPDLVWNKTLAANAQAWADQIARTKRTSHSNTRNIGENIAYGSTRSNTITRFIDLWGAESDDFRTGRSYPKCTRGSESDIWHYSQMVWKKTTQVGCGLSQRDGRSYYVCQYYPKGNIKGEYVF